MKVVKNQTEASKFKIRLSGVSVGTHCHSFVCTKSFFESSEIFDIDDALINVDVTMDKMERSASFSFHFHGNIMAKCDRCLEDLTFPIDFHTRLVVNFISTTDSQCDDESVWTLWEKAYDIDLYQYIYEAIVLELPSQFIHEDDEEGNSICSPEMLEMLSKYAVHIDDVEEENDEEEENEIEEMDPRWEKLKNIKLS